ncbi:amino acid adenylation domain-containing protein, partial [Actinomadura vinacea]|uniref:amino acid adenylation domain-containing protein n=1 Tax=Actinomadura vinacea TaxID=115336 RepID=UPI0031DAF216
MLSAARRELLRRRLKGEQVTSRGWGPRPEGPIPLSFAQQRLWFLDQLEPGSAEYNVPMRVWWDGTLDVAALVAALDALVGRHEVLRTRLIADPDGSAHQVIDQPASLSLPIADVSTGPDPLRAAERLVAADAGAPFDLAAGPLIRACLIRLTAEEHVLALSVHHVIFDEWSAGVFRRELAALYEAFRSGGPDPLPPLEVQYADFAFWQRELLRGEVLDAQLSYWRERLAEVPVLELPLDQPRPPVRSTEGAATAFTVSAATAEGLRATARAGGASMFMTLLAAFDVLLARYCGADDIVVGTPVANRNRAETEDLIGFFVNALVMRTDLSGDPTFDEVVGRVRETALGAYAHQDVPFEQLVDTLVTERDRSRSPLFQVFFNYVEASGGGQAVADGARLDRDQAVGPGTLSAKFDLVLTLGETGDGLAGTLEYSTALFDAATVERMAGHLVTLLDAVAADPGRHVAGLPVLTAAEGGRILTEWNDTAAAVPEGGGVHELIVTRAAETPDAVAVVSGDVSLTYADLVRRADRLAGRLHDAGVGAESVVALCLERGLDMVVAVLAVWRAGGAYLPLDPGYPAERLAFMLSDSGAAVLVGHREVAAELAAGAAVETAVWLDCPSVRDALETASPMTAEVTVVPGQAAYVIYTSGSTGRPKGVVVPHGGVVGLVTAQLLAFGTTGDDVVLQFAPFSFDASVWELVMALGAGATLTVAGTDERGEPELLAELVRRTGVTMATVPPSLLEVLRPDDLRGVRTLITAGERLEVGQAAAWRGGRRLVNAYGPTESTVCASCAEVEDDGSPPIGPPIANTRAYVLDRHLNPLPAGVPGELFIAGPQLARGYGGRFALTAERFVADPFAGDGTRMYRTGDRVRWLPDGRLDFLGRADEQLQVRGFRIEPGEVEAALAAHPGVRTAVVSAVGEGADRRLAAYLVPADQAEGIPPVGELRTFVSRRLPGHMVPAAFVELASLPLTPSGKIDRSALPAPDGARAGSAAAYVASSTEVERVLAEVWAQVLGVERVGVEDNFFELGGDSIMSIRVAARARERGVHVTVAQLFDHQTITALASVAAARGTVEAEQGLVVGDFPLTPIQRWYLERETADPAHFNQSTLLEVTGRIEIEALRAAAAALVEHHDALRSRFVRDGDGQWRGRIVAAEHAELVRVIDATEADDWEFLDAQGDLVQASLDLAEGPLLRLALFDRGDRGRLLLFVVHHLVVDAVSWPVLLEDLALAYEGAELPSKTTSFMAWSKRLAELARSIGTAEAAYWREAESAAPGRLPRDHDGPNDVALARKVRATLNSVQTHRLLHEVPGVFRTQINDVLLCVLGVVLTEWSGQRSVLVDLEGHGREDVGAGIDVSRTVGWFTNVYPVVLGAAAEGDPSAALRRTKEYLRAVPRRGLGYGLLRQLTAAEVIFNYLGRAGAGERSGPGDGRFREALRSLGGERPARGERTHLIEIDGLVVDGRLELKWSYGGRVHDEATVRRLARRYIEVLDQLIDHCLRPGVGGCSPSDFPLAGLDQAGVDLVVGGMSTVVEDVYPLTGLQQGMLFHTQLSGDPGMYWVQNGLLLEGELDLGALRSAWELVFARHEVLRTTVVWEGVPSPLAVVSRSVPLPLEVLDFSGRREQVFADYLETDWGRGADYSAPTLVRLAVIRLAEDRHQLVWSYHHLLMDGWSVPIVLSEVLEAYEAFRSGREPRFAARKPFRDFVAWTAGQDLEEARRYWRERLAGFTEPVSIQVERDTGDRGEGQVGLTLPAAVAGEGLADFARRHRLTVNTVVQGAWVLVVALYSGRDDVVFGVTSSGRGGQIDGMDSMVGLLINTAPVRIGVERDLPVAEWLAGLQNEQARARRFEHTPLSMISECADLPAGESLFTTLFVFENYPLEALEAGQERSAAGGLRAGINHGRDQGSYPLSVSAGYGRELAVRLNYDRARFDSAAVERLAGHLATVLESMIGGTGERVGDLLVVSPAERAALIDEWNDTATDVPAVGGVFELIAARAAVSPDAVALVSDGACLTYAGMLERAGRVAHHLRGMGVGPESIVGLRLERGLAMPVAVLGVWQAGGAYLPLDPDYPSDRLDFMLADSQATVQIGDEEIAAAMAGPSSPDVTATHPDQVAYVIYTSGSTGRPKGVQCTHTGLVNLAPAMAPVLGAGPDVRSLQFASFSFDGTALDMAAVLMAGGTLVVATSRQRTEPDLLTALMVAGGVGSVSLPPSLLGMLDPAKVPDVGSLLAGAERVSAQVAADWGPGRRVRVGYGPTEGTVISCVGIVRADDVEAPPIGAP